MVKQGVLCDCIGTVNTVKVRETVREDVSIIDDINCYPP